MDIRIIGFEDLEKNKWNGSIHYAPNGNIFGYHWYLRSVIKEWDAIIEGDYQSVMPIPRQRLTAFQYSLLPEMGLYSNSAFLQNSVYIFLNRWSNMAIQFGYAFNSAMNDALKSDTQLSTITTKARLIPIKGNYETIFEAYSSDVKEILHKTGTTDYIIDGQSKPESILASSGLDDEESNTYFRLMYNALHRSAGFHISVRSKLDNQESSIFFLQDRNKLIPIYMSKTLQLGSFVVLVDIVIKQTLNKNVTIYVPPKYVEEFSIFGGVDIDLMQIV